MFVFFRNVRNIYCVWPSIYYRGLCMNDSCFVTHDDIQCTSNSLASFEPRRCHIQGSVVTLAVGGRGAKLLNGRKRCLQAILKDKLTRAFEVTYIHTTDPRAASQIDMGALA